MKYYLTPQAFSLLIIAFVIFGIFWCLLRKPPSMKITVSPETTHITSPLRVDGTVNFTAALNEKLAAQTTREDNLIAGLFSLVRSPEILTGDPEKDVKYRERFWAKLGFDAPPAEESLHAVSPPKELREAWDKVCEGEIETLLEFPILTDWVSSTDDFTRQLLEVSRLPGYYHPLLGMDGEEDVLLTDVNLVSYGMNLMTVTQFLRIRGNWDFLHGRHDQAVECALASIRMGQTMRKGAGTYIEEIVGLGISGIGKTQLRAYLTYPAMNAVPREWMLQKKQEFETLCPPYGVYSEIPTWFFGERLFGLQSVSKDSSEMFETLQQEDRRTAGVVKFYKNIGRFDDDAVMRQMNRIYDAWGEILLEPEYPRQATAVKRLESSVVAMKLESVEQRVGCIMMESWGGIRTIVECYHRQEMARRVTILAFALAAWRVNHDGENPDSLEQLVPEYLNQVPCVPATETPMRYVKRERECLITADDSYKLDGSETEIEEEISRTNAGSLIYPELGAEAGIIYVMWKNR